MGFSKDPRIHSILWTGYPGQRAGTGIPAVLFGDNSPSGRLPITFYKSSYTSAIPMESMAMRPSQESRSPGRTYRFVDNKFVVYPFGFGLSYDSWKLAWLPWRHVASSALWPLASSVLCDLRLEASVAHTIKRRAGAALVVLLFLRPPTSAPASAPLKQLRGFERIRLTSGKLTSEVRFQLQRSDFELANADGKKTFLPGHWIVEIDT